MGIEVGSKGWGKKATGWLHPTFPVGGVPMALRKALISTLARRVSEGIQSAAEQPEITFATSKSSSPSTANRGSQLEGFMLHTLGERLRIFT